MVKKICLIIIIFVIMPLSVSNAILEQDAIEYHSNAQDAISKGDLDTAITYLQKSIALNPYFAEAHNDLGVVYERKALLNKARHHYRRAVTIQPDYAPGYMNLAMLEESLGNIDEAIFYWKARIAFGRSDDIWTKRAKLKLGEYAPEELKKVDAGELIKEVLDKLELEQEKKDEIARRHLEYGKDYFRRGEYEYALDEFRIVHQLSPQDPEIRRLMAEATIGIMQRYFSRGVEYYKQNDYGSARFNFNRIIQILPEK